MEKYWKLLRQFNIDKPCPAYLDGPFTGDELALRFVLLKLGFKLEESPTASDIGLVIQSASCPSRLPSALLVLEAHHIAPPLLKRAANQFHLLENSKEGVKRRTNVARLLQFPDSIELALSLIEAGGMSNQLLMPFLLGWRKAKQERAGAYRLFSDVAARWLPRSLATAFDSAEGDFYLGAIEKRFNTFSAFSFCQAAKAAGLAVFESEPHLANLYAANVGIQANAWLYFARRQPIVLTPHMLALLKYVPLAARKEKLQEYLWISPLEDTALLEEVLQQQPKLLQDISKLRIEAWRPGLLSALSPHLDRLERLTLMCEQGFHIGDLQAFLRKIPVYRLTIKGTNATTAPESSLEAWSSDYLHASQLEQMHLSGFRLLGLDGLKDFVGLSRLSLPHNHLRHLPSAIGHLPLLRELDLSGNPLTRLPDSFFHLRLHKLWIDLDQLSDVSRYRVETTFSPAVLQRTYTL